MRTPAWESENAVHLVQEHLRRGGSHEEVRPVAEAMDEGGPRLAKAVRVDERHRDARCQQLVEEQVVLERVERLELALERDHLGERRREVAIDRWDDH